MHDRFDESPVVRRPRIMLSPIGVALVGMCFLRCAAALDAATLDAATPTMAAPATTPPSTSSSASVHSATPWPTERPDRPATCPDVLVLKPYEGRTYLFVAGAQAVTIAFIDAIFFTEKRSYEITLPSLRIDRPSEALKGSYRSAAMTIEAPANERILAASISSVGTSCGAAHAIVPSLAGVVPQPSQPRLYGGLDADIKVDRLPAAGAIVPKPIPGSGPQPCDTPFAAARVNRVTEPDYPDIAREQGAVGTAIVRVDIDTLGRVVRSKFAMSVGNGIYQSAGNNALDVAAANAAMKSSYFPARFACRPDSGAVLFLADFTAQR